MDNTVKYEQPTIIVNITYWKCNLNIPNLYMTYTFVYRSLLSVFFSS